MTKDKIEIAAENYANIIKSCSLQGFDKKQCFDDYIAGALSPEAKEYWQQGMYSEEEVLRLFELFKLGFTWHRNIQILDYEFLIWFNENKKK